MSNLEKRQPILELIHKVSPYTDFDPLQYDADTQGWGSDHPLFALLVSKLRPRLIIEVGSWKGRSAINMATACKSLGLETEIVCVDTWLGSPGIYTRKNDPFYASLGHKFGYPQLYYTFLTNVVRARHQDMITPLPLPSALAAEVLRDMRVKAPLIYIDAAHDYDSVLCDLRSIGIFSRTMAFCSVTTTWVGPA